MITFDEQMQVWVAQCNQCGSSKILKADGDDSMAQLIGLGWIVDPDGVVTICPKHKSTPHRQSAINDTEAA